MSRSDKIVVYKFLKINSYEGRCSVIHDSISQSICHKKNQKQIGSRTYFPFGGINPSPVYIIFYRDKQDITILPSP